MNLLNIWDKLFHRRRNYICIEAANHLIHLHGRHEEKTEVLPAAILWCVAVTYQDGTMRVAYMKRPNPPIAIINIDVVEHIDLQVIKWTLESLRVAAGSSYRKYNKRILLLHPDPDVCNIIQRIIDQAKACPWLRQNRISVMCGVYARMEGNNCL